MAGEGPSPVPRLQSLAQALVAAGASVIAIPSATVHAYYSEISSCVSVPVLHLPEVVVRIASDRGLKAVALFATTPALNLGLYDEPARRARLRLLKPDPKTQSAVMEVIQGVKAGTNRATAASSLADLAAQGWSRGADALVLGCTELPAVFAPELRPVGTLDASDELARAALEACGVSWL